MIMSVTEKLKELNQNDIDKYRSLPFWSWNDELDEKELVWQIRWMKKQGFGGFFMHARGGLKTKYLGEKWFDCIRACVKESEKIGLQAWAYDENGWPSGFVGGELLSNPQNRDRFLSVSTGEYDGNALVSYLIDGEKLLRTNDGGKGRYLNVFEGVSVSTADILQYDVVEQFIQKTHERYKKELGKLFNGALKGFFTDEPQYFRGKHPYSPALAEYFRENYGEDILDGLGLMFVEKDGYKCFRYKYWKAMQALMLKNYAEHVYEWCARNGVKLTGHYIEESTLTRQMTCCAGIMPFYEFEHIPGIDKLTRKIDTPVAPKQVSSVARQLGKKQVLTETYAMCGWDVTPSELKTLTEVHYVNGVNLLCQHLLPYSEHGERKRDYPAHYSWVNPWVEHDYKTFNDYFAKLGFLLGESEEPVNVGVFVPVRSLYFDYKRDEFPQQTLDVDVSYVALLQKLSGMNVPYHLIDETILARHGSVDKDKLVVGKCSYDFVIFPKTLTMDKSSKLLLDEFYNNGGKLLFTDGKPNHLEGEPFAYEWESNASLREIVKSQPYRIDDYSTKVQSAYRVFRGQPFIYAVNIDREKGYKVTFEGDFKSLVIYDLESGEERKTGRKICFEAGQSYLLFPSDEEAANAVEFKKKIILRAPFRVTSATDNYLTLDKARYSFDGENYSERIGYMGIFNEMIEKKYRGEVYLKYEFFVEEIPGRIKLMAEDMNNISCTVNGEEIVFDGTSDFEKQIYAANVAPYVKQGINEAVIKIDFYESDNVYYVLTDKNVTESLRNCLAYDTTIEACYLQGDFGVYSRSGFKDGTEKNVLISEDDFYIGKRKDVIESFVKDGYPFFAGHVTVEKDFYSDSSPCELQLNGRYHLSEIKINGQPVSKSYFGQRADISDYVKKGQNKAEITLYSSNRNLLGPHHYLLKEEPFDITPRTFELPHSWKNGKSSKECERYSFVKFGLFEK